MTQAKRPQAFPGLARMLRPFCAAPKGRALHEFPDSWSDSQEIRGRIVHYLVRASQSTGSPARPGFFTIDPVQAVAAHSSGRCPASCLAGPRRVAGWCARAPTSRCKKRGCQTSAPSEAVAFELLTQFAPTLLTCRLRHTSHDRPWRRWSCSVKCISQERSTL